MKLLVPLALGAILLLAGCSAESPKDSRVEAPKNPAAPEGELRIPADSPKLAEVHVEPVGLRTMPTEVVSSPGKVEANANRLSRVVLPAAGRVVQVFVKLGDYIQQGQPILILDSEAADDAISSYLQADASVSQAKAQLIKAEADRDRAKDLFEHNAVAQKEVINAESLLTQSKAGVDQAIASRTQAQRRLEILGLKPGQFGQNLTVRAPISGKVLDISVAPGEFRNDVSASLMTIADLSSVWVTSDVPESQIRFIQVGEALEIQLAAFPGETFSARVAQIADLVDPQTRTLKVRAVLSNPGGRLRPEMFGSIRHVESSEAMPVVPASSVVQSESGSFVLLEKSPGVFQKTGISTGVRDGDWIAVEHGVKAGDRVVSSGALLLASN